MGRLKTFYDRGTDTDHVTFPMGLPTTLHWTGFLESARHPMWTAIDDRGRNCCVKLISRYGLEVHEFLAKNGRAPQIYGYLPFRHRRSSEGADGDLGIPNLWSWKESIHRKRRDTFPFMSSFLEMISTMNRRVWQFRFQLEILFDHDRL